MKITWTDNALNDIERLYDFLALENPHAAAKAVQVLVTTAVHLSRFPRMGKRLDRYDPDEVRRIFAGQYEIRYQITPDVISILRIWHGRERR